MIRVHYYSLVRTNDNTVPKLQHPSLNSPVTLPCMHISSSCFLELFEPSWVSPTGLLRHQVYYFPVIQFEVVVWMELKLQFYPGKMSFPYCKKVMDQLEYQQK